MKRPSPFVEPMTDKDDVAAMVLARKKQSGTIWEAMAAAIGLSPAFTHSAAMGMNSMAPDTAEAPIALLGLPQEAVAVLVEPPAKVWTQAVPTDPCIDRLYEIVGVYGPTIKALILKKFGDDILSAIDFDMFVTRVEHPRGDRVKVEMTGKV